MADAAPDDFVAALKALYPAYADVPDAVLAASIFHTQNATDARGAPIVDGASGPSVAGTYNYVVADDALIDILRKYGLLAPLAAGAAAQGLKTAQDQP
jgi:hypothetical protein